MPDLAGGVFALKLQIIAVGVVGALVACDAVQDPLGQARRIDAKYDAVELRAPIGLAFALLGGLGPDELHVMCADGPEEVVRSRWEQLPDGRGALILDADGPADSCVATVRSDGVLDVIDATDGPLELSTQQAIRLGTVSATSALLHTSVVGYFMVDDITVRDVTLDARGTSVIDADHVTAELLVVRTDGHAQTAVYDADVEVWEADAWAHATQLGAGDADHVAIYGRGAAQVQMADVRAGTADVDLAGAAVAWLGVDPDDADADVEEDATLTLGP
jgi:hypothetical protein